jgi:3-dehydroshikimate dehydratase
LNKRMVLKKSICTSGFKDWSIQHVLKWAHPLEIDGLELWMGHIEKYQEEHGPLDKLRSELNEYGFEVPIISGYTTFSNGFSGECDIQEEFKNMKRLLDAARQLRSPLVRTFVGNIPSRNASPEKWGQTVSDLKVVLHMADQYDVDIAVEIHYDTLADIPDSVQQLKRDIDHPRLKFVFDGANLNYERIDQFKALSILYPWVKHIHLKNYKWDHSNRYNTKATSIFGGDIDNRKFLEELQKRQYKDFVSLEYFGENREANIIDSLNELKS